MQKIFHKLKKRIILLSFIFGLMIWLADTLLDYLIFYEPEPFWDLLLFNIPEHELYIRSLMIVFFLIFGIITSLLITQLEKEKQYFLISERALKTISGCNQTILYSTDETELSNEICRVIVEAGYHLAWIGYKKENVEKSVDPVTYCGFEKGYLQTLDITWANTERGQGPTGKAIRSRKPVISKNILTDPNYAPWREEAIKRGYASSIALPMIYGENIIGSVNIYSSKPDTFDEGEVNILMEAASDLAYGITRLRVKNEKKHLEKEFHHEKERSQNILNSMVDGVYLVNDQYDIEFINSTILSEFGPVEGKKCYDYLHDLDEPCPWCKNKEVFTGKTVRWEWFSTKNKRTYDLVDSPLRNLDGSISKLGIFRDITKMKKLEQKNIKNSQQMEIIIDNTPGFIFFKDKLNNFIRVNQVFADANKLTKQEMIGKSVFDLYPEKIAKAVWDDDLEVIETGKPKLNIEESLEESEEAKCYTTSKVPIKDDRGEIVGILGISLDITERRKAEDQLQNIASLNSLVSEFGLKALSGESLDSLINYVVVMIAENLGVDQTKVLELLPEENKLLLRAGVGWKDGYINKIKIRSGANSQAGFTLLSKKPVVVEDFRTETRFTVPSLALDHGVTSGMSVIIHGNEEVRPYGILGVHTRRKRLFTKFEVNFLQSIANIITHTLDRKKYEKALLKAQNSLVEKIDERTRDLLEEKQRFETIVEVMPNSILVLNVDGSLSKANGSFRDLYQRIFTRSLKSDFNLFDQPKHILFDLIKSIIKSGITTKNIKDESKRIIEPIKGLYLQLHYSIIRSKVEQAENLGNIIELRDITRFIELERLRDQFTSSVSHELRTPITAIDLSISNLQKYWENLPKEDVNKLINMIKQNSYLLNQMIEDLLIVSRIDTVGFILEYSTLSIKKGLETVSKQLESKINKKGISLQFDVNPKLEIEGDNKRLNQVYRNLLDNAIKYSPDNSTVNIKVIENYQGEYNPMEVEGILIQFSDLGIGISDNDKKHLFKRFFRSRAVENIQGTGLGLFIAKEIIMLHKGEIYVESKINKGSTFSVFLPKEKSLN